MLYNLMMVYKGKETLYMTDILSKVKSRMETLRSGSRGTGKTFTFYPANEEDKKYRKPPTMGFDPSGDANRGSYIKRKKQAKRIKKKNT